MTMTVAILGGAAVAALNASRVWNRPRLSSDRIPDIVSGVSNRAALDGQPRAAVPRELRRIS
jgi:hypothetical protein